MKLSVAVLPAVLLLAPLAAHPQDLPESSPQALMHHAQGVAAYVQDRYQDAIPHFVQAHQSDPTFYVALLMAGVCAGNAGLGAKADSFYALVAPHKDRLSAYYRARLDAAMAGRVGNLPAAIEANRRAAAVGPGTKASYNVAQGTIQLGRAHEARQALRQLDPDREPMKGWASYYTVYANAGHQLGDYDDELQMARRARGAFPGNILAAELEAEALAALGRTTDAERVLAEIQTLPPTAILGGPVTPGQATTNVALEFAAHGNAAAATQWLEVAVRWFEALPAAEARTLDNRVDKAYVLYVLGRYREAAAIYDELVAEFPGQPVRRAQQGFVAGLMGDRAKAIAASKAIETNDVRLGLNGPIWRGLIAAALDDDGAALALFQQSGVRARWMHRDPVLRRVLGQTPGWIAYLKPVE